MLGPLFDEDWLPEDEDTYGSYDDDYDREYDWGTPVGNEEW